MSLWIFEGGIARRCFVCLRSRPLQKASCRPVAKAEKGRNVLPYGWPDYLHRRSYIFAIYSLLRKKGWERLAKTKVQKALKRPPTAFIFVGISQ